MDPASYRLPNNTFILNQKGIARELSLPPNGNTFKSDLVSSHRLKQGILNNPANDKRTTKGTFHVVAGSVITSYSIHYTKLYEFISDRFNFTLYFLNSP